MTRAFSVNLLGCDGYGVANETKACTEVVWRLYHMVGESEDALFELLDMKDPSGGGGHLSFIVGVGWRENPLTRNRLSCWNLLRCVLEKTWKKCEP